MNPNLIKTALKTIFIVCLISSPVMASDINYVNSEINKTKYVKDTDDTIDDWKGLSYFLKNGGDCEDFAKAKMALLMKDHKTKIVYGQTLKGEGHAVLWVDGYYLDNRFNTISKTPHDFIKPLKTNKH